MGLKGGSTVCKTDFSLYPFGILNINSDLQALSSRKGEDFLLHQCVAHDQWDSNQKPKSQDTFFPVGKKIKPCHLFLKPQRAIFIKKNFWIY
jgi:hypothetical protein